MIEDIQVIKSTNKFHLLNINENGVFKTIKLFLKNVELPFGVEEYKNKYIINIELSNNSEYEKIIRLLEKNIHAILDLDIEYDRIDLNSVFHKKPKHKLLCRTNIKKTKNKIVIIFVNKNNEEISIFDIPKNLNCNIELEISGIWKHKFNYGIYIHVISIHEL